MGTIHLMDGALVNKIAAGEVVERPASVVKELLENSLDAGATAVKIEIEGAGKRKITVSDNGFGMAEEDCLMCYQRHATSKIFSEEDLFRISTLGFRGEALAAIVAVSSLMITTCRKKDPSGVQILVEAGRLVRSEHIGVPVGTMVEVSDLFFNVPARKKFMKSDEVEFQHILDIVTRYALVRNDVLFQLFHNGKQVLHIPATNDPVQHIASLYGVEIAKAMMPVQYDGEHCSVSGVVSKPSLTRGDKTEQSLYVNGRYVKHASLGDIVYQAMHTLLFINRHPLFVLNIVVDPAEVDANVHPAKTVVKFKDEKRMETELFQAVRQTLSNNSLIVDAGLDSEATHTPLSKYPFSKDRQSTLAVKEEAAGYDGFSPEAEVVGAARVKAGISSSAMPDRLVGPFVVLGQVNRMYIVAENPQGIAIVDQHAAEERVNYERFMRMMKEKAIVQQKLVSPRVVELNPMQMEMVKQHADFLARFGFTFELFGSQSVKLLAVPEIFGRLKGTLFLDVINELSREKTSLVGDEIESRIIRFSCKASVKAGDELTKVQMEKLMDDLTLCENPFSCPHGRPTFLQLSVADLEKKFKRLGW